jgi:hypothetical protein
MSCKGGVNSWQKNKPHLKWFFFKLFPHQRASLVDVKLFEMYFPNKATDIVKLRGLPLLIMIRMDQDGSGSIRTFWNIKVLKILIDPDQSWPILTDPDQSWSILIDPDWSWSQSGSVLADPDRNQDLSWPQSGSVLTAIRICSDRDQDMSWSRSGQVLIVIIWNVQKQQK